MRRLICILGGLCLCTGILRAEDPLEKELRALVTDVAKVLEKQNQTDIRMGKFTGDGDIPSNFGPEIQRILLALFQQQKIGVSRTATIEIKGDYRPVTQDPENPQLKEMFVRINARLVNTKSGKELADVPVLSRAAYGNELLLRSTGVPVGLPPSADRHVRNEVIRKQVEKPESHAVNSLVKSSEGSPFAVELLVVPNAKAPDPARGREVSKKAGLPFVEIKKDEVYRIKIHNNADFDVAVKVEIDGLDMYSFADRENRNAKGELNFTPVVVIKKGTAGVIRGWFRTLSKADSFQVSSYAESAVAELNASQADIGMVCVRFFAAWDTEEQLRQEGAKDAIATKRGESVDQDLKLVQKYLGTARDQVAIRYAK